MNKKSVAKLHEAVRILHDVCESLLNEFEPAKHDPVRSEIDYEHTPWMDEAMKWFGKSEDDDNAELAEFLGIDPAETPWCAAFVDKVLENTGYPSTGSLRASDFAGYGRECDCIDGAVAVFDGHVGFVAKNGNKILGGNQGDSVKYNNLAYYHKKKKFLGYYWPVM